MIEFVIGFIIMWVGCGVLAMGLSIAHMQKEYPLTASTEWKHDLRFGFLMLAFGISGLIASLSIGGIKHGLMYRKPRYPLPGDDYSEADEQTWRRL